MAAANPHTRFASGDFVVDLLQVVGVWPPHLDPMSMGPDTPLPDAVVDACRLLCAEVTLASHWFEVTPELDRHCGPALSIPGPGERPATVPPDEFDRLFGDYPWHERGPLWYSSGMRVGPEAMGAVVFGRDGWFAPDPDAPGTMMFVGWDATPEFRWPGSNGHASETSTGQVLNLIDGDRVIDLDHSAIGSPSWGALSLKFASAVLGRVLPEVRRSNGEPVLRHPPIRPWTRDFARAVVQGIAPPGNASGPAHREGGASPEDVPEGDY